MGAESNIPQTVGVWNNASGQVLTSSQTIGWVDGLDPSATPSTALARVGSSVLAVTSGSTPQFFRVYGGAPPGLLYITMYHDGTSGQLYSRTGPLNIGALDASNANIAFIAGGSSRWQILGATGELYPNTPNTYDIGDDTNTVRTGYFGTSVVISGNGGLKLSGQTDYTAFQTATLTNGPTSGNPAKWLPIYSDGVLYKFPVWA